MVNIEKRIRVDKDDCYEAQYVTLRFCGHCIDGFYEMPIRCDEKNIKVGDTVEIIYPQGRVHDARVWHRVTPAVRKLLKVNVVLSFWVILLLWL